MPNPPNFAPFKEEFDALLRGTLLSLQEEARLNPKRYVELSGNKLENEVYDILNQVAKNTPFEGTIELISGQRFPDIIVHNYYGIEVKTTKSNHWKSTGSSVAEGTRVEGIERIFMLFGKIIDPVEFMCKPYEECLSEVVVTHSPRYLIDMNLKKGDTIFDKLEIRYDELRQQPNPIKTILNHYRKQLKPGDDVWYLDQDSSKNTNLIIRLWNNLSNSEKNHYMVKGFCFFPELVSNYADKFNRFALWLSTREGIICPNVRDIFSAGGQGVIHYQSIAYEANPQIIMRIYNHIEAIKNTLNATDNQELSDYWKREVNDKNKFEIWLELVAIQASTIIKNQLPLAHILRNKGDAQLKLLY